jgi:GMP synthase (glutamine-hydrolysing)
MFPDTAAVAAHAAELRALAADPSNAALVWKHGLGPAMVTESLRLLEIRNWLESQVSPRAARNH